MDLFGYLKKIRRMFYSECPNCKKHGVRYIGEDFTGRVWFSVYECIECKEKSV